MSGFARLDIVDLDVIEYSNLNRQFYFDERDMWKPKALVTAEVMTHRFRKEFWFLFFLWFFFWVFFLKFLFFNILFFLRISNFKKH
jgi:hypothetical protein